MTEKNLSKYQIFSYAILAFPLSFVGLPIYINISDFYAKEFGLSLSLIGVLLIFVRAIDLLQDPLVGYFSDFAVKKKFSRKKIIYISSSFLSFSFYFLFNPPTLSSPYFVALWFFVSLSFTYTFFNFSLINFESIAAIIAKNKSQRISINSAKEFFGLVGILTASILPFALLKLDNVDLRQSYFFLSIIFAALIFLIILTSFRKVEILEDLKNSPKFEVKKTFLEILKDQKFTFFLLIFLINAVAVSIPSATVIFYVEDVLEFKENFGVFLAIYFLSGCLFISLWKNLAQKFGKIKIWIISIFGSVITFVFAYFLDAQSANYFYLVCFFSGMFLGADLIMPPAIIADLTENKKDQISSYFSLWNMFAKLGLMIASSSSLLILGSFNYQPGGLEKNGIEAISFVYAILPCLLKILVIFLLFAFQKKLKKEAS